MEFSERLADALRREIYDEYGIEIAVGELLDVADSIGRSHPARRGASTGFAELPLLDCGWRAQHPRAGKCSAIAWFAPDDLPAELTEVKRVNLASYLSRCLHDSCRNNSQNLTSMSPESPASYQRNPLDMALAASLY